jgi:two-component system response regulator RegX3
VAEQTTVLLVEDEESFIDALTVGLRREGFRVQVARDGAQALDLFDAVNPDLVLLDVMLPRISGIDVCRQLRKRSQVPIIMVTAKGAEIDTVVGLEVGADDYVTKPYRLRELVARMRAVLRRAPHDRFDDLSDGVLEVGDVRLDPERHEVAIRG